MNQLILHPNIINPKHINNKGMKTLIVSNIFRNITIEFIYDVLLKTN